MDEVRTPSGEGVTKSLFSDVETWPCGCAKGMTPHGAGWSGCIFSDEQKAAWKRDAARLLLRERNGSWGDPYEESMLRGT